MGMRIAFVGLLLIGAWSSADLVWARGGQLTNPPSEMVGKIQVVEPRDNRLVMEERGLEVWATDRSQLEGLAPGQTIRLRFQAQYGRLVIISIAPVTK